MSDPTLTIDDLNALPEKMRAHAAAKAVGMTSKEFLAAMAGIGVEIKSAQSGVTREALLTWFAGREGGADTPAAEPAQAPAAQAEVPEEKTAPAKKVSTRKKAAPRKATKAAGASADAGSEVADVTGGEPAADAAIPDASAEAPAEKAPARKRPAKKAAQKTAPAEKAPAEKTPAKKTTDKQAPSASGRGRGDRPELPDIAIVTGEVGTAEPQGRRRRSTATPTFSPLFLSPDEAEPEPTEPRQRQQRRKADTPTQDAPVKDTDDAADTPAADTPAADDRPDAGGQDDQGEGGNRRRRRGRRGRGRGRGEGSGDDQNGGNDADTGSDDSAGGDDTSGDRKSDDRKSDDRKADDQPADDTSADSGDDSSEDASDGSEGGGSGSRRRRRRRRRGGSGSGSDDTQGSNDDPPHTEVHEREPRRQSGRGRGNQGGGTSSDEVQGISGSTRLEAKRQRRRDGREAGRRRQPILSEAEFLARREAVDRVMVVREKPRVDGPGIMTQVGVLEDKVLVEHFVTTESARSMVGNVYLGRVQNVLPSMEAAFVDIGRGRNGVLYAGEVNWEAAGLGGKARRIEQALKPGDMVLVQVTKDPVGQKGARLTTQISLAGRFLVYVPDGNSTGISRKLPDTERRRLKAILQDVVPEGSGVIIRTAAEGVSEEEIGRDVQRLAAQWTEISEASEKRTESGAGTPVTLYEEPDLLVKVVRDLFNEDFSKLVIQGETSWGTVHDYVSRVAPEMVERLERYENPDVDVFATYRVDEQLAKALDRKVWLPSGGSLVIDRTEAMTVIDVNTGKYTGSGGNLEETVTKNNLEAAEEIVRQLRLRDVGGMVIVDFIDMVLEANRDLVLRRLTEALGRDRTRHQVSEVTSLGLVQLTRKKLGTGLVEAFSTPCEHCQGRGLLVHADPVHTESHNADEPGARRGGRRRGGKGSGSGGSGSGSGETPQIKSVSKGGPAPSAHPAALAIKRQDGEHDDEGHDSDTGTEAADAAPASEEKAPAETRPAAESAAPAESGTEKTDAEQSGGSGTRTRRRRRATSAPATAPEPQDAPKQDAPATPEPVQQQSEPQKSEPQKPESTQPESQKPEPESAETAQEAAAPVRRPRRRSTRREAGSAVTPAASPSAEPAPVAVVPVEAAPLAEAPPAVVAEPRKRPARRRATRSTVTTGESDS